MFKEASLVVGQIRWKQMMNRLNQKTECFQEPNESQPLVNFCALLSASVRWKELRQYKVSRQTRILIEIHILWLITHNDTTSSNSMDWFDTWKELAFCRGSHTYSRYKTGKDTYEGLICSDWRSISRQIKKEEDKLWRLTQERQL
jgi:hypothetical protein